MGSAVTMYVTELLKCNNYNWFIEHHSKHMACMSMFNPYNSWILVLPKQGSVQRHIC